jgi:hypothetical protein
MGVHRLEGFGALLDSYVQKAHGSSEQIGNFESGSTRPNRCEVNSFKNPTVVYSLVLFRSTPQFRG